MAHMVEYVPTGSCGEITWWSQGGDLRGGGKW